MTQKQTVEIGLVLYPGAQQASVLGLTDLFTVANRIKRSYQNGVKPPLKITHWQQPTLAASPKRIFDSESDSKSILYALILPPTLNESVSETPTNIALAAWLGKQHANGVVLGSVCAGAFLLAATGLMAGRPMTTHWTYADQLQEHYPQVRVDTRRLIIDDGDVITAGGLMSWTDLGLRLVDRLLGSTVMIDTARMLLVDPPGREQRYYSVFSPRLNHGDEAILNAQHWLQATQANDVSLAQLATQAGLEERTFLRRFKQATGMTSTEYCQRLRVGKARELLQFGGESIEQVAWEVGYSDTGAFRKVFTHIVGLSPSQYRQRFRASTAY